MVGNVQAMPHNNMLHGDASEQRIIMRHSLENPANNSPPYRVFKQLYDDSYDYRYNNSNCYYDSVTVGLRLAMSWRGHSGRTRASRVSVPFPPSAPAHTHTAHGGHVLYAPTWLLGSVQLREQSRTNSKPQMEHVPPRTSQGCRGTMG